MGIFVFETLGALSAAGWYRLICGAGHFQKLLGRAGNKNLRVHFQKPPGGRDTKIRGGRGGALSKTLVAGYTILRRGGALSYFRAPPRLIWNGAGNFLTRLEPPPCGAPMSLRWNYLSYSQVFGHPHNFRNREKNNIFSKNRTIVRDYAASISREKRDILILAFIIFFSRNRTSIVGSGGSHLPVMEIFRFRFWRGEGLRIWPWDIRSFSIHSMQITSSRGGSISVYHCVLFFFNNFYSDIFWTEQSTFTQITFEHNRTPVFR